MSGTQLAPTGSIKILGVLLDASLTWEIQAEAANVRSRNACYAVQNAARHLNIADRSRLLAALALPPLDYCRLATSRPSVAAADVWRRAYHRAARIGAGTQLSLRARVRLNFPQWASSSTALARWVGRRGIAAAPPTGPPVWLKSGTAAASLAPTTPRWDKRHGLRRCSPKPCKAQSSTDFQTYQGNFGGNMSPPVQHPLISTHKRSTHTMRLSCTASEDAGNSSCSLQRQGVTSSLNAWVVHRSAQFCP